MTRFELPRRSDQRFIVGTVSIGHLFSHVYLLALPPLFPLIRDELALTNTELGFIISVMMFPIMLLQLPIGRLVDTIGAKHGFVAGLLLTGGATALFAVVPNYWYLLGVAALVGVGQAFFHPSDYALLSAVVEKRNQGKGFSVHTFGGYAGFAIAPVVIGGIGVLQGWRVALLLAGVAGLAYGVFVALSMDHVYLAKLDRNTTEKTEESSNGWRNLLSAPLIGVFLFFMLLFMAGTGIQSFTTVFLVSSHGLPELFGNYALTAFFTCSAIGVIAGGFITDRYDTHLIIVISLVAAGVLTGLTATDVVLLTGVTAIVVFSVIGSLSGIMRPARDSLVSTTAPTTSSGQSFGFVFSGGSLGGLLSPMLLGYVIDTTRAANSFLLIGAFFASCAVIVAGIYLRSDPRAS